jgi:hypothetical protein
MNYTPFERSIGPDMSDLITPDELLERELGEGGFVAYYLAYEMRYLKSLYDTLSREWEFTFGVKYL